MVAVLLAVVWEILLSNLVHYLFGGFCRIRPPTDLRKIASTGLLLFVGVGLLAAAAYRVVRVAHCRPKYMLVVWGGLLVAVVTLQVSPARVHVASARHHFSI